MLRSAAIQTSPLSIPLHLNAAVVHSHNLEVDPFSCAYETAALTTLQLLLRSHSISPQLPPVSPVPGGDVPQALITAPGTK